VVVAGMQNDGSIDANSITEGGVGIPIGPARMARTSLIEAAPGVLGIF
jgi:hypothetical protein